MSQRKELAGLPIKSVGQAHMSDNESSEYHLEASNRELQISTKERLNTIDQQRDVDYYLSNNNIKASSKITKQSNYMESTIQT